MHTRLNRIYNNMKSRCYNSNNTSFGNYGAKGITVCNEWLDKTIVGPRSSTKGWLTFKTWALSNGYADDLTIDRIDNSKEYSPNNCRWVDYATQSNNTSYNHIITYKGRTQTLKQWCDELGLSYGKIATRILTLKWTVEKAFETGINPRFRLITYNGKTQNLRLWCRELGLSYDKVLQRFTKLHWSVERAFKKEM